MIYKIKMNFVYLTTNLVNGKQYVGSHEGDITDAYLGSGKNIIKAIKKYGKYNFKKELIEECDPCINMIMESKYIEKYKTLIPFGYNISPTGGHTNGKLSEETKKKISESLKGEKHPNFGKPSPMRGKSHSIETRKKMSEKRKGISAWNKNIKQSEETKKKISESLKGEKHPNFGKHLSNETKEKIRQKNIGQNKGIPRSEETKKKISEYWRKRRE
jgi:hypothetical protein